MAATWATPQARDHFLEHTPEYIADKKSQGHGMRNLNDEAPHWSTPKASDGEKGGPNMRGSKGDLPLPSPGCGCMDCWLNKQREMLSDLLTIEPPAQGLLL